MYEADRLFNERFSEAMQVVADPNKESLFFCIKDNASVFMRDINNECVASPIPPSNSDEM
jgi:hypothetical protein